MTRGLVFGKFMPLHRGHQLVIERALADSDSVTVAVYDSSPAGDYPDDAARTSRAVDRRLYPDVEAVVPLPDPRREPERRRRPEARRALRGGLAFLGALRSCLLERDEYEALREPHRRRARRCRRGRELVPISGTKIREDVYEHRAWLDPRVYATLSASRDSWGRSPRARRRSRAELADRLDTLWAHEYGRELWAAAGRRRGIRRLPDYRAYAASP